MRLNKLVKRIFAFGFVVSLLMANAGMSFADGYKPAEVDKNPVFKTTIEVVDADAKVPNATIKYTVTHGDAIPAKAGKYEVIAPTEDQLPTIADVVFEADKAAEQEVKVDFSGVKFTAPGLYRYKIEQSVDETKSSKGVKIADEEKVKYLDVYVLDDTESDTEDEWKLKVETSKLHTSTDAPDISDGKLDEKTDEFKVKYESKNLDFSKKVAGNQASRIKEFEFTLTLNNASPNTVYKVDNRGTEETLTIGSDGSIEKIYTLKDGETVKVFGIAPETKYTIKEDAGAYEPSFVITDGEKEEKGSEATTGEKQITENNVTVAFTNKREGTIPTGVILDSAPFILVIALAAAALVITAVRKKSR